MEIRLLGPVELVADDAVLRLTGSKILGLVAVLASEVGTVVPTERLRSALWGEQETSGPNVLQVLISKLRRALADAGEPSAVTTHATGYSLDREVTVDLDTFELLVTRAHSAPPEAARALLADALALWRGDAFGGAPETDRFAAMRARVDELRHTALDALTDVELRLGHHDQLVGALEQRIAEDPLRERRWGQLIRALYASGRQADAIRAYQRARQVLVDEVGAEPGPELRRLETAVLEHDDALLLGETRSDLRPVGDGFKRRGNLRHPLGTCVGRTDALRELERLSKQHRLITLIGAGGVGKTRLAQEIGVTRTGDVEDGVWWVDLASARSEFDVAAAVQRALGIETSSSNDSFGAVEAVVAVMGERNAVLIVDNCEQVVDGVRHVLAELVGRCPRLSVIATSRARLDIAAEVLFDVAPLDRGAAVELFESRMTGNQSSGAEDARRIIEICDRLDRLPLALELAAARTRYLRLDEIEVRLSNRLDLPGRDVRSAAGHHANLRAVADWSYELLGDVERRVFERLSVFADGATLSAIVAVCGGDDVPADDVESIVFRLVDQSLVVADRSGSGTRFRMLQTLSDYAAGRLAERVGDESATRHAHALWVNRMAATVAFGVPTEGDAVATVHDEDVAVRDAVAWALEHDRHLALEICNSLAAFWFGTMRVSSGWELLAAALAAADDDDELLRAAAQAWAAVFTTMLQDLHSATDFADAALTVERRVGDPARLGRATLLMALAAGYRSDPDWHRWIVEARAHFDAAGLSTASGHASFAEGAVELLHGDMAAASDRLHAAIGEFRQQRDHLGLVLGISRLGELAWRMGDIELYADMHEQLLELGIASRSSGVRIGALARLGHARLVQGDIDAAARLAGEALAGTGSSFMPVINGYAFRTAGLVNLAQGHVALGRDQLRAAIEAFSQGTGTLGIGQAAICWIDLTGSFEATDELDEAALAAAHAVAAAAHSGEDWVMRKANEIQQRVAASGVR